MILTRLRLIGFKSFVEPTDFLIEPGLTGVVGPNGCGKSNLVEALRWVMGETSHKSMRAADMDAVIFSGSGNRPARNTAEVSMAVDNSDRKAPAAFNEYETLEIARRIEREAGSTYRINGREVRARDVQLLFADASTGSRSPALVHQGRIGEIIQAKPEARRRVLEEAAGVAGLHARRHEAELRLRAAEQNLARLEDVIGQLASQMDALKRQARQAIRYRAVSAQVRKAEATLAHLRWTGAQKEVGDAEHARDLAVRIVAERTGEQAEVVRLQTHLAADLPALREAEAAAAAALHRLVLARETLDREEQRARDRIAELDRRLAQLEEDLRRERALGSDAEAALARLAEEEEALGREVQANAERRSGAEERVAAADAIVTAAEKTFGELTGMLADLSARRSQLQRVIEEHATRIERLERESANIEAGLVAADQGVPDVGGLAQALEAAQAAIAAAEAEGVRAEAAHAAARERFEAARGPLADAERAAQRLDTEARTLRKLLDGETKNLWPPVIDHLTVTKGYETALGAALGDDLDAPIEPSAPMRWTGVDLDPSDPALPEGVEPLASHVTAPGELARRLAQIGVVSRADGARFVSQLKPGQRLVSVEGDLWRWDGFAAAAHSPTGAARRLAERSRLADIDADLIQARSEVEVKRGLFADAQATLAAAASAEGNARERRRAAQREVDTARENHARAEREIARNAARVSALREAQARLRASHEEAVAARDSALHSLNELAPTAELEERLAAVRSDIAARRAGLAEASAEAQALAREAELASRRLSTIATERKAWAERKDGAAAQMAALDGRIAEARTERASLEDAPQRFAEQRQGLIGELEKAEEIRRAAADKLAEAENTLAETDRAVRASQEILSLAREEAARAQARGEAAHRRLGEISHEIREMLEVEPAAVAQLAGIEPGAELPDVTTVEADLDKLRRERERLGAVNLRAEEELREVEAQHTSLTAERDDLVEAIKRLRQGIQNLNKEARERLLASFEVVNGHFQRLFTGLFGGGNAELQLIESDDPLEAGLEILAKPPGQ